MSSGSPPRSPWQPPSLAELQALLPGYEFHTLLGCGGMGAVFKAAQRSLNRSVAIKVLPANLLEQEDANFAARFRQEALTMAKLTHPGIVSVFESGEAGGLLYIVMEFVDGTDVARMIAGEGRIAPELAAKLLTQICDALHYAHERGVIHRDIKPANLLVTRDGTVKIADFGLAKHDDATLLGLTKTNVAIGTPDFLAPEAWTPNSPLDRRADLYSLGVTLYQMLTGEIPRGFWEMPSARVGTDARFDAIIERALQPKPEARYQSSAELRRDLERIQAEPAEPGGARRSARADGPGSAGIPAGELRPGPADRAGKDASAPRFRRALVVVAVLLASMLTVLLWPRSPVRLPEPAGRPAAPPRSRVASANPAAVRAAADWLVKNNAQFKVSTARNRSREVKTTADIPTEDFDIVTLWFDRWGSALPWPPEEEFQMLRAVTTFREVFVRLPGLSDPAFEFLAGNSNLTWLAIEGTGITDRGLAHFARLPRIRHLILSGAQRVTGEGFAGATWLDTVEHAHFLGTGLNDAAAHVLAGGPRLTDLNLGKTLLTREGLQALTAVTGLTELSAEDCPNLSDADYADVLPGFKALRILRLSGTGAGDETAAAVGVLTNLVHVDFAIGRLTDAGLARLSILPRLRTVIVHNTRVTEAGIAAFEQARPDCQLTQ